jgi:light-regulated signal transduction histidine kinase (bacteriophytochrome)
LTADEPRDAEAFPEGSADPAEHLARAERVLAHLRNALSHDVSNQLVAVQGLLQLLQMEERDRLSADGQDYVRRAAVAAQRAQGLLATLKELIRLGAEKLPQPEVIYLDGLFREVAAEVKAHHPACALECRLAFDAVRVSAPGRLLHQALLRVVRGLFSAGGGATRKAGIRSRRVPHGVELTVAEGPLEGRTEPPPQRREADAPPWGTDRHDWVLVRELAEACGGSVAAWTEPGRGGLVTLVIPAP